MNSQLALPRRVLVASLGFDTNWCQNGSNPLATTEDALRYQEENPPDLLVRSVYLDDSDGLRHLALNDFFCVPAYEYAVKAQCRLSGRHWPDYESDSAGQRKPSSPENDHLGYEACLRLLDLPRRAFTRAELVKAYRAAIKLNHPDKVACKAEDVRQLAEQRTRLINLAYAKLLSSVASQPI